MLTKPLPSVPAAQADADRPQLRIAARATPDARPAPTDAAELIAQEIGGWHTEWRRTLQTFKAALNGLEETCQSTLDAQEARVSGLIDTLVQGAAAEAAAIAAQTRDQAQVAITDLQQSSMALQATVHTLQSALDQERENVKRLTAQLEREAAAADALRANIQTKEADLAAIRQQLEAAAAERTKLATTFRLVQRAMALSGPIVAAPSEGAEDETASAVDRGPIPERSEPMTPPTVTGAIQAEPAVDSQQALIDAHPDAAQQIGELLEQMETMYHEDAATGCGGIEMADRLTANLRHARSISVTRWSTDDFDALTLFDHLVSLLLDRQAGSAFARHLGIAAYTLRTPESPR